MVLPGESDLTVETSQSIDESQSQKPPLFIADIFDVNQSNFTHTRKPFIYRTEVGADSENSGPLVLIKDEDMFELNPPGRSPIAEIMNTKKKEFFEASQKWEGRVDKILETGFMATITDLTIQNLNDGYVEIDLEELTADDLTLVREGAIFYWCLGHYTNQAGNRLSSSLIIFRRLPKLSPSYGKRVAERAKRYFDFPAKPND
jgi:hypothetical protein